ncbi:MAG: adenylosuccinate lyase [Paracoccaceae bacterium]
MINRYSRPEMTKVWSQKEKYRIWFEIEAYACEAMEKIGLVPEGTTDNVLKASGIDYNIDEIDSIEKVTKHDVIAFLTYLSKFIGESSRFVHQGLTSSDVLDTCLNVQLVNASNLLEKDLHHLLHALKERAFEHKDTVCIGRSHGIFAEPTTFGLKLAQAYAEMQRNLQRLQSAKTEISTGALSGAVGTFANIDPKVETMVCEKLNLRPETISTQVIPRDRHAMFFSVLAIIASSIERIATEIRHLSRSEVLEAEESFSEGQKGSSAMPHKRNPVLTENLTGLARLIRMAVIPALENISLWHERDISHSSVERNIGPDTTITLDFAITRLSKVIKELRVYPENMKRNMSQSKGLYNSQQLLLMLTQKGVSREDAYSAVQKIAMNVWNSKDLDFMKEAQKDDFIKSHINDNELEEISKLEYHTKFVNALFSRVFGIK